MGVGDYSDRWSRRRFLAAIGVVVVVVMVVGIPTNQKSSAVAFPLSPPSPGFGVGSSHARDHQFDDGARSRGGAESFGAACRFEEDGGDDGGGFGGGVGGRLEEGGVFVGGVEAVVVVVRHDVLFFGRLNKAG